MASFVRRRLIPSLKAASLPFSLPDSRSNGNTPAITPPGLGGTGDSAVCGSAGRLHRLGPPARTLPKRKLCTSAAAAASRGTWRPWRRLGPGHVSCPRRAPSEDAAFVAWSLLTATARDGASRVPAAGSADPRPHTLGGTAPSSPNVAPLTLLHFREARAPPEVTSTAGPPGFALRPTGNKCHAPEVRKAPQDAGQGTRRAGGLPR